MTTDATKKVAAIKPIWELGAAERRKNIATILRNRRDELVASILYNTGIDEKVYSETDYKKLEIRVLNKLLKLPKIEVATTEELTEEQIIANENDELDIWSADELFTTQD